MHIINNLQCLASTPMDQLAVDGDKLRPIRPQEIVNSEKLQQVIADTFQYVATHEDPLHRFWTKAEEGTHTYVSPGFLAAKLKIASALALPQEKEERHLVTLEINKKSFVVEKETLAAHTSSLMLRSLLTVTGRFAEAMSEKILIELPLDLNLDEDSMQQATTALFQGQLPNRLDINRYIDLALFFNYFQANDLLKASVAKIASLKPILFEWIALLRLPDEVVDGVIAELSEDSAKKLLEDCQRLSIDAVRKNFDPKATAVTTKTHIIEEIRGEGWAVNMRRFAIALVNKAKTPLTEELLDFFGVDIGLLRSANLSSSSRPVMERVMANCPNLQELRFNCAVDDIDTFLPKVLNHWPQLLKLTLVKAKDDALKHLALVPMLQDLSIARCTLLEADALKHLASVPMLQHLDISYCRQLEADALKHLASVPILQDLSIAHCTQLEADALKHLASAPMLQDLSINSCTQLEADALKHLALLPMLQDLNISYCTQLEANALQHLASVPMLQDLIISYCTQLEASSLQHLARVPMLQDLSIAHCTLLEADALKHLASVPMLQHLDISYCRQLEADTLKHLASVPMLQDLSIVSCTLLEADALKHLASLPMLQHLDISYCTQLEANALQHLARVPMLQYLSIARCTLLEADALKHLASVPMLQHLDISYCTQLEADALKHLASVPMLQYLYISYCTQLEADALKHLASVPMLQYLYISYCTQLEADALKHLASVPMLQDLSIVSCTLLEAEALKHLIHTPFLTEIHIVKTNCQRQFIPENQLHRVRIVG